jgi:hypothetical protein
LRRRAEFREFGSGNAPNCDIFPRSLPVMPFDPAPYCRIERLPFMPLFSCPQKPTYSWKRVKSVVVSCLVVATMPIYDWRLTKGFRQAIIWRDGFLEVQIQERGVNSAL